MSDDARPAGPRRRIAPARLVLLASGDFACNLYWQSLSFFLLFFYTDLLGLGAAEAGLLFAVGSVWDGLADAAVGAVAERVGGYRRFVAAGAVPLGLAFVGLYAVWPPGAVPMAALVLAAHLAFRTLYALVNIPFAALSARVTDDSRERARIAAYRMLFGTAAAMTVALVTRDLAARSGTGAAAAPGYFLAAIGFATVGTALLLLIAATAPAERVRADAPAASPLTLRAQLGVLARNRAFVTLNLASAAIGVSGGVLNGSIMFYFAHVVGDAGAGPAAMAWMGLVGAAAVPGWMWLRDACGTRALWLADAAIALVATAAFALAGGSGVAAAQLYVVTMHIVGIGFAFGFWAMLPDTVEWGEWRSGRRVEALAFGLASLGQKIAIGAAAALLGLVYHRAGYVAGSAQAPATAAAIRATMLGVPAAAILASAAAMAFNPLRRATHAGIAARLAARQGEAAGDALGLGVGRDP